MALSRKFLSALGIEEDKAEQIISAHSDTVDGLKEERDEARRQAEAYKADAGKLAEVQKELKLLKEEAEKNGGNAWKAKYEDLEKERDKIKSEYEDFKTATEAEKTKDAKEKAYRVLLKEVGISEKRIDSVMKVTDLEKIELDDDGKIKDADKKVDSIKEEWADFITTSTTQGANTATPPANTQGGGDVKPSRAALLAKKYHENLYGKEE